MIDAQAANNIDFNNIGLGDQLDGLPGGMFDWGEFDLRHRPLPNNDMIPKANGTASLHASTELLPWL